MEIEEQGMAMPVENPQPETAAITFDNRGATERDDGEGLAGRWMGSKTVADLS